MIKPMKPVRIAARDRRNTAIHEAGHVTIGRHVGLKAVSAWLEETSNPGPYDKLWVGKMRYLSPTIFGGKLPRKKLALVAVAGAVADCCWQKYTFEDSYDDDFWLDEDAMSESDWLGCGCDPGNPTRQLFKTIETVFSLLDREAGALWPALLSESRRLIEGSRETSVYQRPALANGGRFHAYCGCRRRRRIWRGAG
jgi:hypothetical protein